MTDILLMNQINLVLQLIILALFSISIVIKKVRGKAVLHGKIMVGAYALNLASLLFIMIPLFLTGLPIVTNYPDNYSLLFLMHHSFGLITLILSTFLILRFARGRFSAKYCRGLWLMRGAAIFWGLTMVFGLYLYQAGYFPG